MSDGDYHFFARFPSEITMTILGTDTRIFIQIRVFEDVIEKVGSWVKNCSM